MYLSSLSIENFRCFGAGPARFEMKLKPGLTALVGENEAGKTAVIDALRFALGTTDQEWFRIEDSDFYGGQTTLEIRIACKFEGLRPQDRRAFVEYLTYGEKPTEEPVLYVNWTAKDTGIGRLARPYRRPEVHSGKDGKGPTMAPEVRELLRATYLRPLRDAEQALSAGRGSRLSQVLLHTEQVRSSGVGYSPDEDLDPDELNVLGIGDLANALLGRQQGIVDVRNKIDTHLSELSLRSDSPRSSIKVSGSTAPSEVRLRNLLEKLDLVLDGTGKLGLGSNNLLFMACELLLLAQEDERNKLLLIEEPEAHLHAQRQLQVMTFLQNRASTEGIQIIITTHSPNLASAIELDSLVMVHQGRAFSMSQGETELSASDYRFLTRFLDVTKANLFFARGVLIVEGDAEAILGPTLARLIGRDFTEHGVSIVNVGGVGLRRYARIFQRKNVTLDGQLSIPVACVTDMDVMPDCAPLIVGKVAEGTSWPTKSSRRWRAKRDLEDEAALALAREAKREKASGQYVKTFVSDEWTLEYDLALGPRDENHHFPGALAEDVFVAACLADNDDAINAGQTTVFRTVRKALKEFAKLKSAVSPRDGCSSAEVLASKVYADFAKGGVSKPTAAQYLAEWLQRKHRKGRLSSSILRELLPKYLVDAIEYVTGGSAGIPNEDEADDD